MTDSAELPEIEHGEVLMGCQHPHQEEPCWGVMRWYALNGGTHYSVVCEGHFHALDGKGYLPPLLPPSILGAVLREHLFSQLEEQGVSLAYETPEQQDLVQQGMLALINDLLNPPSPAKSHDPLLS